MYIVSFYLFQQCAGRERRRLSPTCSSSSAGKVKTSTCVCVCVCVCVCMCVHSRQHGSSRAGKVKTSTSLSLSLSLCDVDLEDSDPVVPRPQGSQISQVGQCQRQGAEAGRQKSKKKKSEENVSTLVHSLKATPESHFF